MPHNCGACGEGLGGPFTRARGSKYHPKCWRCAKCNKVLKQDAPFQILLKRPHCTACVKRHPEMFLAAKRESSRGVGARTNAAKGKKPATGKPRAGSKGGGKDKGKGKGKKEKGKDKAKTAKPPSRVPCPNPGCSNLGKPGFFCTSCGTHLPGGNAKGGGSGSKGCCAVM